MIYIIIVMVGIANILVFKFDVNTTNTLLILSVCIGFYKGIISEKKKDILNIHPFIFKLKSKENVLELVAALMISIIMFKSDIIAHKFGLLDLLMLVAFTLFLYRFLFYGISKNYNNNL